MKSAETGYNIAQYNLGCMYNFGSVPDQEKNIPEAIKWYTLAAEQGEEDSQYLLGVIYEYDYDDMEQAMKWYVKAALQNQPLAVYLLQHILIHNHIIGHDYIMMQERQINKFNDRINTMKDEIDNLQKTNERMKKYINELECLPPDEGGVMYQYHKKNFYQT